MSLLHAPATRAHPARPTTVRPRLTVVPPLRAPAPKAPFVLLVGALLTTGLGGLLFLHTAIAEDSFRLHDLTARSAVLTDREQALGAGDRGAGRTAAAGCPGQRARHGAQREPGFHPYL